MSALPAARASAACGARLPGGVRSESGTKTRIINPPDRPTYLREKSVRTSEATRYHRERRDVILMPITSQLRAQGFGEIVVEDWQAARLLKPSAIKPVIATLEHSLLIKTLGRLSARDTTALRETIPKILG